MHSEIKQIIRDIRKTMNIKFEQLLKDSKEKGRKEGRREGRKAGRYEGVINTLICLVKKGLLTVKDAANQANMTEKEFKSLMIA